MVRASSMDLVTVSVMQFAGTGTRWIVPRAEAIFAPAHAPLLAHSIWAWCAQIKVHATTVCAAATWDTVGRRVKRLVRDVMRNCAQAQGCGVRNVNTRVLVGHPPRAVDGGFAATGETEMDRARASLGHMVWIAQTNARVDTQMFATLTAHVKFRG